MVAVLCVGLGGFIGSVGRYLLGLVPVEGDFPLMTFTVNFAGALLERGKYATGALYACGSVLACLAGVVIGRLAVRGVRAALTGSAAA